MSVCIDWNLICLVCLQEGEMHSILSRDASSMVISEKIMKCSRILDVTQLQDQNIPQQICTTCLDDLEVAYRFHTNCEKSSEIYKSLLSQNEEQSQAEVEVADDQFLRIPSGIQIRKVRNHSTALVEDFLDEEIMFQVQDDKKTEAEDEQQDYYENTETLDDNDVEIEENEEYNLEVQEANEIKIELEDENEATPKIEESVDDCELITEYEPAEIRAEDNAVEKSVLVPKRKQLPKKNGKKPPKICEICGNSYKFQHALDSHMRRHRNEKPFNCDFCDKSFVANVELRRHMRVHTGQKPYQCHYCPRRFSDFGSRIKHERTHTGERPYVCSTCGKSFAYAHVLTVHNLTHTGEKKYKCEMCGKGFTKKIYLQAHMASHNASNLQSAGDDGIVKRLDNRDAKSECVLATDIYSIHEDGSISENGVSHGNQEIIIEDSLYTYVASDHSS